MNKSKKQISLGALAAVAVIATPIATVVSCGEDELKETVKATTRGAHKNTSQHVTESVRLGYKIKGMPNKIFSNKQDAIEAIKNMVETKKVWASTPTLGSREFDTQQELEKALEIEFAKKVKVGDTNTKANTISNVVDPSKGFDATNLQLISPTTVFVFNNTIYETKEAAQNAWLIDNPLKIDDESLATKHNKKQIKDLVNDSEFSPAIPSHQVDNWFATQSDKEAIKNLLKNKDFLMPGEVALNENYNIMSVYLNAYEKIQDKMSEFVSRHRLASVVGPSSEALDFFGYDFTKKFGQNITFTVVNNKAAKQKALHKALHNAREELRQAQGNKTKLMQFFEKLKSLKVLRTVFEPPGEFYPAEMGHLKAFDTGTWMRQIQKLSNANGIMSSEMDAIMYHYLGKNFKIPASIATILNTHDELVDGVTGPTEGKQYGAWKDLKAYQKDVDEAQTLGQLKAILNKVKLNDPSKTHKFENNLSAEKAGIFHKRFPTRQDFEQWISGAKTLKDLKDYFNYLKSTFKPSLIEPKWTNNVMNKSTDAVGITEESINSTSIGNINFGVTEWNSSFKFQHIETTKFFYYNGDKTMAFKTQKALLNYKVKQAKKTYEKSRIHGLITINGKKINIKLKDLTNEIQKLKLIQEIEIRTFKK